MKKTMRVVFVILLLISLNIYVVLSLGEISKNSCYSRSLINMGDVTDFTYQRSAAVTYGMYYYNKYLLSDGYNFYNCGTGDCAHFVSCAIGNEQNLRGGGLSLGYRWHGSCNTYYYGVVGARLPAEDRGYDLIPYLINHHLAKIVSSVDQLFPGDIIQYRWSIDLNHVALYVGEHYIVDHYQGTSPYGYNVLYNNSLYSGSTITFVHIFDNPLSETGASSYFDISYLQPGDRVKCLVSGLKVREGPGVGNSDIWKQDYKIKGSLLAGDLGTVKYGPASLDGKYVWYYIQWDNQQIGWSAQGSGPMLRDYLEKISSDTNPSVTTNSATNITQTTATLNATVNPNGDSTYAYFQWGLTTSYGNTTTAEYIGSGTSNVSYPKSISGLSPNTTYHFRAVAYDTSYVNIYGSDMTFTTSSSCTPPTATTNSATNITYNSATLNATVNPNGLSTTVWFQYGTTTSYGSETTHESIGSGTSNVSYSKGISGLSPNTTYHFRIVASSSCNTTYGSDVQFTTPQGPCTPPTATTNSATFLGNTPNGLGVVLYGNIIPNDQSITAWFQYGTTMSYGFETDHSNLGTGSFISIGVAVYGLSTGITYHFRIVAQSRCGTAYGNDMTFILSNSWQSPILSSGTVSPASGDTSTTFTYLVNYYDPQGFAPAISNVYIDGTPYSMFLYSGIGSNGIYRFQSTLPGGSHNYYFQFSDGLVNTRLPTSGTYSGPDTFVPPTIHLTQPNGGETLTAGTSYTVQWTIAGDLTKIDHISVDYSTDNGTTWHSAFAVFSSFSNSMSKSWTVPNVSSTNCKLKIALKRTDSTWSVDYSDNVFTIQTGLPTVTLTYPNGGNTLTAGTSINVTWTISGDLTKIDHISVDYTTDNGATWHSAFAVYSPFSSSMSKSWTVPYVFSTTCKLKIALKRTDATWSVDYSDSVFTIQIP